MGRTVIPYSLVLEQVHRRFKEYRQGLRREDREVFDDLIRVAKSQMQAGVMAHHPNAFDAMSMAMLIDLKKQINQMEKHLQELEKKTCSLRSQSSHECSQSSHE